MRELTLKVTCDECGEEIEIGLDDAIYSDSVGDDYLVFHGWKAVDGEDICEDCLEKREDE